MPLASSTASTLKGLSAATAFAWRAACSRSGAFQKVRVTSGACRRTRHMCSALTSSRYQVAIDMTSSSTAVLLPTPSACDQNPNALANAAELIASTLEHEPDGHDDPGADRPLRLPGRNELPP